MAQYLIAIESSVTDEEPVPSDLYLVEAKNMKEAARNLVIENDTEYTGQIWRVDGPAKRITLCTTTKVSVDIT